METCRLIPQKGSTLILFLNSRFASTFALLQRSMLTPVNLMHIHAAIFVYVHVVCEIR